MNHIRGVVVFCLFMIGSVSVHAQELVPDTQEFILALVVQILNQETKNIPGTDTDYVYQTIQIRLIEGADAGKEMTIENDYLTLKAGERFYLMHTTNSADGRDTYSVSEPYRVPSLIWITILFIVVVVFFGGKQGMRGLVSLSGSVALILFVLLPGILKGYSPVVLALSVSALITTIGSYVTHGFKRSTTAAVLGMLITIALTGFLAFIAVPGTHLTGIESEDTVYLNFNTNGKIDLPGLLLGGILIGLLGVLYDAAIGQAVSVDELALAGPHLGRKKIFRRALRIGREHIGALINTLAIAYVGSALPLLLLFASSSAPIWVTLNRESFSAEIVRTFVGGIGVVLAVPITTAVATMMLVPLRERKDGEDMEDEDAVVSGRHSHR